MRIRNCIPLLAVAAAFALPASGAASGSTPFADPAGDSPAADVTAVTVSNDDTGLLTFAITIANRPAVISNLFVFVFLNTDQNDTTGDTKADGADYALEYDGGQASLGKWNGTDYDWNVPHASLSSTYANGPTMKVSAADLGNVTAFTFYVAADEHAADGTPQLDFAPDITAPDWSYTVQITPPAAKPPVVVKPKAKAKPKPKPKKKKKH